MIEAIDEFMPKKGFNFENYARNSALISAEDLKSHFNKTGTTIVGVTCREGVVLAADTRATGHHVAEKNCNKVHFIAPNITCCGAGTAADNEYVTSGLSREAEGGARAPATQHRPRVDGLDHGHARLQLSFPLRREHRGLPHRGRLRCERAPPLPDHRKRIVG